MARVRFPTIRGVSHHLVDINKTVDGECDVRLQVYPNGDWYVRLQVYPNGDWYVRWGLADFDTDHTGFWGSSIVPGRRGGRPQRFNAYEMARDLIEQAREQYAEKEGK